MPKEDIRLTKFTVKYPYKKGFFRGKREGSDWQLPPVCPCCGAEATGTVPERVECSTGNREYWFDFKVPYCETCLAHVRARKRESKAAHVIGVIAGAIAGAAVYAAIWQLRGGGDPFKAVDGWYFAPVAIAAVVAWAGVSWLVKNHFTGRAGAILPRTEKCTSALKMELTFENVRMLSEPDLLMYVFCANPAFAAALRERNPGAFAEEKELVGTAERTQRGDLVIVETERLRTEEEIMRDGG